MTTRKPIVVPESRFTCEAKAREADVHLYGSIGQNWWGDGIDPTAFVKTVDALDVDTLRVWVNSPGGDVFGGIAMMNALRRQKATVTVTVDGLAASAASFIALGGDELVMGRNSQLMVHDASGMVWGNAADMSEMSATLDKISDNIASMYAEKAGGETSEWRDVMRAETWMTADEAVELGLADRVDAKAETKATAAFDLSVFAHAGRQDAPAPRLRPAAVAAHVPPAEPGSTPTHEGADMSDTLLDGLRTRLGINAEISDEATVLAALDEALTERADEAAPTPALPDGVVMIEASVLESLRTDATEGRLAREQQVADRRESLVASAVAEGRIPPARRDHWLAQLAADEVGASAVLESLAPNTIPVVAIGYTGGVDEADVAADTLYSKVATATTRKEA